MSDILQRFQKRSPKQMEIELNKSIKERIFHAVIFEVAVRRRFMNKLLILFPALCLSGCVDLGKIGTYPEVASFYINHPKARLQIASYTHHPENIYRWNLMITYLMITHLMVAKDIICRIAILPMLPGVKSVNSAENRLPLNFIMRLTILGCINQFCL